MPIHRTGYVEPLRRADGSIYFKARIRLGDDSRERVDVPEKYSVAAGGMSARERAELYAAARQEREDETHELLAAKRASEALSRKANDSRDGETCDKYFARYVEHCSATGRVRRTRDLESSWSVWISPKLGGRPIAGVTRDEVEDVRDELDAAVASRKKQGGRAGLSGARARNVWSVLTAMMKEACSSKRRELRVRDDNPCDTVQPPDKTDARAKTFIYPNEFLELVACLDIPQAWRELYAVACCLYMRPGELRALLWTDVDSAAGVVHVTKAYDEDSGTLKAPKTRNGVRDVPIDASLVPLLKAMRERATSAYVVPVLETLSERRRAGWMREHFTLARIERARLTEESATTMQINFRSCRDTGITWLALQGVDVAKIQRRAGHDEISTTLGYVKMAEDLTGSIGTPFPPLPTSLIAPTAADLARPKLWPKSPGRPKKHREICGEGGIRTRG